MVMDPVGHANPAGIGSGYLAKSTGYSVAAADRGKLIDCTGTFTLSLPAVVGVPAGFSFIVRNASTGIITLDGNSSETINGATTARLIRPRGEWVVYTNGSAWFSALVDGGAIAVRDFGALGDGTTDDYAAISAAIAAAATALVGVTFDSGSTYALATMLSITSAGSTVPTFIDGHGATLKAITGLGANPLVKIEKPDISFIGFSFRNLTLDGNAIASIGLYLHGSQRCEYRNLRAISATSYGYHFSGESNYGIYYNEFANLRTAKAYADANGSNGFQIVSIGAAYYFASNTMIGCIAHYNKGYGFNVDYASPTFIGCGAEVNDLYGWNIDHSVSVDLLGGYSEQNNQNRTTRADGTGNGNPDGSINASANSTGVKVIGGRHIGAGSGTWTTAGMYFNPGAGTTGPILDTTGRLRVAELRSDGGIGLDGSNPAAGTINGGSGGLLALQLNGTNVAGLTASVFRTYKDIDVKNTGLLVSAGSGSPEGVVTAPIGSMYQRSDGGAGTAVYFKESGAGNTGWVAGEESESKISTAQNAAGTGTYLALTSLALTPGDWDLAAIAEFSCNSATTTGAAQAVIGTTSASGAGTTEAYDFVQIPAGLMSGAQVWPMTIPRKRVSISSNTTYYLNVLARFSLGTPQWYGSLSARRVR